MNTGLKTESTWIEFWFTVNTKTFMYVNSDKCKQVDLPASVRPGSMLSVVEVFSFL
jgi:hypothetical protein